MSGLNASRLQWRVLRALGVSLLAGGLVSGCVLSPGIDAPSTNDDGDGGIGSPGTGGSTATGGSPGLGGEGGSAAGAGGETDDSQQEAEP